MSTELLVRSGQLQRKAVEPILNSARRIQSIVELIVDFSRAQSNGVMPISSKVSNLRPLFDSVLAETQVRHPSTELTLRAEGDLEGVWDEGRLAAVGQELVVVKGGGLPEVARPGTSVDAHDQWRRAVHAARAHHIAVQHAPIGGAEGERFLARQLRRRFRLLGVEPLHLARVAVEQELSGVEVALRLQNHASHV
jgi:hypothetical protein